MVRHCDIAFANTAAAYLASRHLKNGSVAAVTAGRGRRRGRYSNSGVFSFRPRCSLSSIVPDTINNNQPEKGICAEKNNSVVPEGVYEEEITVSAREDGLRVDKVLSGRYARRSRAYFQQLLSAGNVTLVDSDKKLGKSHKVSVGEVITVRMIVPQREQPIIPDADIPLDILYEDEHIAVINKAPGIVVHPAPGNWSGTLAHALVHRYGVPADSDNNNSDTSTTTVVNGDDSTRAGIVHRLDKGTSGALIIARTRAAHDDLSRQFAARTVQKTYLAITIGTPGGVGTIGGVITEAIGRDPSHRIRMAIVPECDGGKRALTSYEILGRDSAGLLHLVRLAIHTGRTHQIRVHLRHKRAPVLGDQLYGAPDINRRYKTAASRPLLHAYKLAFTHPVTRENIAVQAPLPLDMKHLINQCIAQDDSLLLSKL